MRGAKHLLAFAFIGIANLTVAQWDYGFEVGDIPVVFEGDTLDFAWTGGLTAPMWSPIDLDFDSDMDLFVFDRDGHRVLAFERDGEDWKYRPEWCYGWPEMNSWCLLRDYDCDGKPDIFTAQQNLNTIMVYKNNTVDPLNPQFDLVYEPLTSEYEDAGGLSQPNVFCQYSDTPAIQDLDGDGDLDIITFTESATTLYKYEGQTECGLDMVCTNRCYGMLAEASENNNLYIGDDFECQFNVLDPREDEYRHLGGSITALQLDANGPLDLLMGDVTYPTIVGVLLEDAYDGQDSAVFTDFNFPLLTNGLEALDCQRFPAAYRVDVDADGVKDLICSPNTYLEVDDDKCVHYLRNAGTDELPVWDYVTQTFLHDQMIDMGRGAYPRLKDIDGDGLIDLIVSNKENNNGVNDTPTKIHGYKNIGTLDNPVFEKPTEVLADLATFGIESAVPALGDLDGDGDLDLIVGDELGLLHYYVNESSPNSWPIFEVNMLGMLDSNGERIDIQQFAAPQLIDINNDGLLDLVIGEKNGNLNLYLNCGTTTQMSWCKYESESFGDAWGNIFVDNALMINGYSNPSLVEDAEGIHLIASNEVGSVEYFGLVQDDLEFEYSLETINVLNYISGVRSSCAFADLNNDGKFDCLMGIQNGGIRCYYGSDSVTINTPEIEEESRVDFTVYPNPGNSTLNWRSSELNLEIKAFNSIGKLMGVFNTNQIPTDDWPAGSYFIAPTKTGSPYGPPVLWIKLEY